MDRIYTLWDTEEAYPLYTYQKESEALAEVAAAVQSSGEGAVATWGLFLATPSGDASETIAVGHDLAELAMKEHSAYVTINP
ncbi:MAG: hypothetical protein ACR2M3_20710 [Thermomicrobiales bacterium]